MAITEKFVVVGGAGSHDGSSELNAWSLSEAISGASPGNRINIKKGTYTRASQDLFTADGTTTAPIVWRGYNSSIGDLDGIGRDSGNGLLTTINFPAISYDAGYRANSSGANYNIFQCLKITGNYDGPLITMGNVSFIENCSVNNASTNAAATAITLQYAACASVNCDAITSGASGSLAAILLVGAYTTAYGCRIKSKAAGIYVSGSRNGVVISNNVIDDVATWGIDLSEITGVSYCVRVFGNTIYSAGSGGILGPNAAMTAPSLYLDNHVTDCTGYAFDSAYKSTAEVPAIFACNRTRDNSSGPIDGHDDWASTALNHQTTDTGGPETDYANAGSGDFNLISGAPGRGKSSMPYRDIGAVQARRPGWRWWWCENNRRIKRGRQF